MLTIDLSQKTAFVTGGAGQLGRAIVRTLARAGANVAVGYRKNSFYAEQLAEEVRAMGVKAVAAGGDVTDLDSVLNMRGEIEKALGPVHILVNNAVSQYEWKNILDQDNADFVDQFQSCVMHNVNTVKAFVPAMQKAGWGRVIAINSECSNLCNPGAAAYSLAKRGLDGLFRSLTREIGRDGITVNQVAPGWMISDNDREKGTEVADYDKGVPLGHRGEDADIANAVAFLASDMASFISGVYLPVAGGHCMPGI